MENFLKQGTLFPLEDFIFNQTHNEVKDINNCGSRKKYCNNMDICLSLEKHGKYDMPILQPYDGPIPNILIPFNQAMSNTIYGNCGVHFFIDDYQFERVWNNPDRYIVMLSKYSCVIGPDFSQYRNLAYPHRIWNCYRNRVVSSYLQQNGVKIIPNVTWSTPDSFDYSFDGIPQNSVIAINCSSIKNCRLSTFLWYKGYAEALKRLKPKAIIRYGTIMQEEQTDISYYFENERLRVLKNGR